MSSKVLYLSSYINSDSFFEDRRNEYENVENVYLITKKTLLKKILMGIGYYLFSPLLFLVYGKWKKNISDYDLIILDSRRAAKYAVKYIPKKYKKRVIVWYWNKVTRYELSPEYCRKCGCEVWSFDQGDCEKYNMFYNDTYSFKSLSKYSSADKIVYDAYYVGKNKEGRLEQLLELKKIFESQKLSFNAHIVDDKNEFKNESKNCITIDNTWTNYTDYLKIVSTSKAIIELNILNQTGLTQRVLESIYLKKKLITNNINVINCNFYDKNNIFILGVDNPNTLCNFITSPFVDVPRDILDYYDFGTWLDRIIKFKIEEK